MVLSFPVRHLTFLYLEITWAIARLTYKLKMHKNSPYSPFYCKNVKRFGGGIEKNCIIRPHRICVAYRCALLLAMFMVCESVSLLVTRMYCGKTAGPPHAKRHLDRSSRFATIHPRDQQTHRQTHSQTHRP